uniref:Uncharacterized protein n=1 Tax=Ditylenchus dipsaci TaxID=166011 RepID=A0A915D1Q6_9BILA
MTCYAFPMPPKRGKAYKVYNISNNIHLQESTTDVDKLSYIGLAISEATALLLSLNKLYTGLQALYHQILSESKEHSKAKIENASAPKLLKATVEQHSESEGDEEYHGSEEEEEEEKIEPKKK